MRARLWRLSLPAQAMRVKERPSLARYGWLPSLVLLQLLQSTVLFRWKLFYRQYYLLWALALERLLLSLLSLPFVQKEVKRAIHAHLCRCPYCHQQPQLQV